MLANSPLQVYSYVIGAKAYDDNFTILASMGLLFLPLVALFATNIAKAVQAGPEEAQKLLKQTYFGIFIYVLTVMIFIVPGHQVNVQSISYEPQCNLYGSEAQGAQPSTFGDTGTTLDKVFQSTQYEDIHLPIGLQYIMMGASGATNAMMVSLPCKIDVNAVANTLNTTNLTPTISQQLQAFHNQCYAPALAQMQQQHPDPSSYETIMNNYGGQTDLNWPGSYVLQNLYYNDLTPTSPVVGFPYAQFKGQYDQYNEDKGVINHGEWGYPTCNEWWNNSEYGLKQKLVNLVDERDPHNAHLGEVSLMTTLSSWIASIKTTVHLGSQVTADDVIARSLIESQLNGSAANAGFGRWSNPSGYMNTNSTGYDSNFGADLLINAGNQAFQAKDAIAGTMTRNEISMEIPIMTSVMLALLLALGPMLLILGGCKLGTVFSYSMLLVAVISIPYVEAFIHLLEVSFHQSQATGVYSALQYAPMYNAFTKLYMWGPLIYLSLLSIVGVSVGQGLNKMIGGGAISGSSAKGVPSMMRSK